MSIESENSRSIAANVAVHVVVAVTATVVEASDEESGVAPALHAQLTNRYPPLGVAEIDHESSPSSVAETDPPADGVFAAVTVNSELAVKVAVHVVATAAVTFVAVLTTEFGV